MAFTSTPLQNSRLKSQGSFLDVFGQRLNSQRLVLQCLRRILQVEGVRRFCLANKTPQNLQVSPPCSALLIFPSSSSLFSSASASSSLSFLGWQGPQGLVGKRNGKRSYEGLGQYGRPVRMFLPKNGPARGSVG